jgi:DNA-binding response OmpR family regulator
MTSRCFDGTKVVNGAALSAKKPLVLVVEDDQRLSEMYRMALGFSGIIVHQASDGVSALREIEATPPDVVVLDLDLPQLRGEAILDELADSPSTCHIPVIVVTGSEVSSGLPRAAAVLCKPYDPEDLRMVIEQHLIRAV